MTSETPEHTGIPQASVFACYGHGRKMMLTYFLELLLITAVYVVLTLPTAGLWGDNAAELLSKYVSFNLILFKISGIPGAILFSTAYAILIEWPLQYGVDYASLKAARSQSPGVGTLFAALRVYWNAVLASLLSAAIIIIGIVLLVIPGIYFIVKLSFVPYLVIDRRLEPVPAVKESWRMTTGYGWKIFGMYLLALPILLLGLLAVGIGIIISIMWINLAFASLYHVISPKDAPRETPLTL